MGDYARSPEPGPATQCDDLYRNLVTPIEYARLGAVRDYAGCRAQIVRFGGLEGVGLSFCLPAVVNVKAVISHAVAAAACCGLRERVLRLLFAGTGDWRGIG
jgi:hypothetical protein